MKPNLINVIPNHVVMSVDLRNTDNAILCLAEQQLAEFVAKTSQEEGVEITSRSLVRFNPVIFADEIVNAVEAEAERQAQLPTFAKRRRTRCTIYGVGMSRRDDFCPLRRWH